MADDCRSEPPVDDDAPQDPTGGLPDLTDPALRRISEDLRGACWHAAQSIERCDPDAAPIELNAPRILAVPEGFLLYRLQLRPGHWIEWGLPADLTRADVERLRRFLEVLPVPADLEGESLG